jgi:hypothetical protein
MSMWLVAFIALGRINGEALGTIFMGELLGLPVPSPVATSYSAEILGERLPPMFTAREQCT